MGYYINLIDHDFYLDKKHFDNVYQKMCELNDCHDLKRGGSFGSNNDDVEGERYPKSKWFSWMDYNYPETCKNMFEILDQLGFEYTLDPIGNLVGFGYYNKMGNEEYFLNCFSGFAEDESYITFKGEEDDHYYRFVFVDGKMCRQDGEVQIQWVNSEIYEFGEMTESDKKSKILSEEYRKQLEKDKLEKEMLKVSE